MENKIAILYSGGTDSTCVAAIMAEKFKEIDLLTYERIGIYSLGNCNRNVDLLRNKFPAVKFKHEIINVDPLARYVNCSGYLKNIFKYGFFALSNCLVCGLINHFATLLYCLENNITVVADGSTREWALFPTHIEEAILELKKMYARYNINYITPVYDFETFTPVRFVDKLFADARKDSVPETGTLEKTTTGNYLFKLGIFPASNMKGTKIDQEMQPRCLQFVLHHIYMYWNFLQLNDYDDFVSVVLKFSRQKIDEFVRHIENNPQNKTRFIKLKNSL